METFYRVSANSMAAFHALYTAFVIFGQVFIVVGSLRRWQWVRNIWFRAAHLASILFVIGEVFFQLACPFTVWERWLRVQAGETPSTGDFFGNIVKTIVPIEFPQWSLSVAYILFAGAVLWTWYHIPPRRIRTGAGLAETAT